MAFGFGKNKGGGDKGGDGKSPEPPESAGGPPAPDPNEGPGKGKAFFDRARTVGNTGNYDYAIDMYIEGLNREPFNVAEHQNLWNVAMNRRIKGGKAAGGMLGGAKGPYKGKTPKEAMLNNEFILAKDPSNINAMLAIIRNAVLMELKDVIFWIGPLLKEANRTSKKPQIEIFKELAQIYKNMKEYNKASDAVQAAIALDPTNMELVAEAKDLAAQETLVKGNYEKGESFSGSIKDVEGTKKLLEEDNLGKTESYLIKAVEEARAEYEKNPMELPVITKLAKALEAMGDETNENEAIELLHKAYASTKIFRLKAHADDIRIRQYRRDMRMLKEAATADPSDKELLAQLQALNKERLAFELASYQERAEHMPTDMLVKYELGTRLWEAKRYDEAIVALQEAQNNPKHRVDAMHLLGRSFLTMGMKPEAVETLKRSIDEYDLAVTGDKKSRELHYWYAMALESNNNIAEAIDVYSKIIRWDIGFKDARKRLQDLRERQANEPPPA